MNQKTYSEIVAKRPELAVRFLEYKTEVWTGYERWVFKGSGIGDDELDALIFKRWTEMLPEKHGLVKWGDSWAIGVDTHTDGFQFRCVEDTPLDALTEFWRTYEG